MRDPNIGRLIVANDGYSERIGQIIAKYHDEWGDWYVVAFEDGKVDFHIKPFIIKDKPRSIGFHFLKNEKGSQPG